MTRFHRVASGDYETADGRYRLYRLCDINPPAWNVEDTHADVWVNGQATEDVIVDGARTKRDALALFADWERKPCFCPDDCGCRRAHRTNVCGCKAH